LSSARVYDGTVIAASDIADQLDCDSDANPSAVRSIATTAKSTETGQYHKQTLSGFTGADGRCLASAMLPETCCDLAISEFLAVPLQSMVDAGYPERLMPSTAH
jgi:hypothetical protein